MGGLFSSILSTSNSLRAFQQGLNVVQSNVANASTPGYAKQTQEFEADTFDLGRGLPGGVSLGTLVSSRDEYAEQLVRDQQHSLGEAQQRASDIGAVEPAFPVKSGQGIAGALDAFFASASALSIAPNDTPSRQVFLDRASQLAQSFNQTSATLTSARANADREINNTVASINDAVATIRSLNADVRTNAEVAQDPGFDARLHNALGTLASLVNFTSLKAEDGTTTILIGGQTLALVGDHQYKISAQANNTGAYVLDAQDKPINSQLTGGQLGAELDFRNTRLPSYLDDLDQLASSVADNINSVLNNGLDSTGNTPATSLFTYDAAVGAAQSLGVNQLNASDLGAASATAPGGNGAALQLAALAGAKQSNGFTFSGFYGDLAARVGRDVATAQGDVETRSSLLSQAQTMRDQESQVSLDEEAAKLMVFQKSFEAAAKMVSVLTEMTDSLLAVVH